MVTSVASFALGVLSIQCLPGMPGLEWIVVGIVVLMMCAWLRRWKCLLFLAGLLWAAIVAEIGLNDRLTEDLESKIIKVSGRVIGLPVQNERRVRFDLAVYPDFQQLPSRMRLNWYYPEWQVKAGQRWNFTVKLKRPHGNLNPGGFDYERWLFRESIGAIGYVRKKPTPVRLSENPGWFEVSVWRQAVADGLDRQLGEKTTVGIIKALTLGDRHQLSPKQWDVLRETGTAHLMAISGLHIGLVAGLIYFLASWFWVWAGSLKYSPQKIAAVSALLAALFYAAMAGFSVPTQRALIMLAVVMLAGVRQRNARPFNTLALALFAVLLPDPLAVLSAGFWLSFLAVAVIVYTMTGKLFVENRFGAALRLHWRVALALSPLLLFFFQQVSLIAPVANTLAVPVVSLLVVPMALLAVLLMEILPSLSELLLGLVDSILQALFWLLTELAALPFAYLNQGQPELPALLLTGMGLLLVLAPKGIPARWLGWVLFAPLFFVDPMNPEQGEVRLTLLDVGQGLSAVVQTATHSLVFDTGARFDTGSDMGASVLVPFLRNQGIGKIDSLIISHGDNDHIGGTDSLVQSFAVDHILTSVPENLSRYSVDRCEAGQAWLWDGVRFSMLAPGPQILAAENDNSCVLKIESEFGNFLLTGDIEQQAESWLVQTYGGKLRSDIMVAPHHGSKTSSTRAFLRLVRPEVALIPAGYKNRFGFPHKEILQRYEAQQITWLNAAEQGAITVHLKKSGREIHSQRREQGRYWNMKPE
ncbi:MAG: DNA internalization-related competence protein ComEC/Rec2 [Gammaproteobacteria bacterium]